jgi:hypothetical protein
MAAAATPILRPRDRRAAIFSGALCADVAGTWIWVVRSPDDAARPWRSLIMIDPGIASPS